MDIKEVMKGLRDISKSPKENQVMVLRIKIFDKQDPKNKSKQFKSEFENSCIQGVCFEYNKSREEMIEWLSKDYPQLASKIEDRAYQQKSYYSSDEMLCEINDLIEEANADVVLFVTGGEWTNNKQWYIDSSR